MAFGGHPGWELGCELQIFKHILLPLNTKKNITHIGRVML